MWQKTNEEKMTLMIIIFQSTSFVGVKNRSPSQKLNYVYCNNYNCLCSTHCFYYTLNVNYAYVIQSAVGNTSSIMVQNGQTFIVKRTRSTFYNYGLKVDSS